MGKVHCRIKILTFAIATSQNNLALQKYPTKLFVVFCFSYGTPATRDVQILLCYIWHVIYVICVIQMIKMSRTPQRGKTDLRRKTSRCSEFWYIFMHSNLSTLTVRYFISKRRFQNWVGTSYLNKIDARHKGSLLRIYNFQIPQPPKLMVWKSDFFWWFMRFVRVPPYESWANWTNFLSFWENCEFFWGQTWCTLFHTQNEEKSQKTARVYAYTHAYTQLYAKCMVIVKVVLNRNVCLL